MLDESYKMRSRLFMHASYLAVRVLDRSRSDTEAILACTILGDGTACEVVKGYVGKNL